MYNVLNAPKRRELLYFEYFCRHCTEVKSTIFIQKSTPVIEDRKYASIQQELTHNILANNAYWINLYHIFFFVFLQQIHY